MFSLTGSWRCLGEHKSDVNKKEEKSTRNLRLPVAVEVRSRNTFTDHRGAEGREDSTRPGITTKGSHWGMPRSAPQNSTPYSRWRATSRRRRFPYPPHILHSFCSSSPSSASSIPFCLFQDPSTHRAPFLSLADILSIPTPFLHPPFSITVYIPFGASNSSHLSLINRATLIITLRKHLWNALSAQSFSASRSLLTYRHRKRINKEKLEWISKTGTFIYSYEVMDEGTFLSSKEMILQSSTFQWFI